MATNKNSVDNVLKRAVGVGGSGTQNLGAYKDANGNTTTYRPEFAGQTVQVGNQYVTYNEQGYPTKSLNVQHAQNLGNNYTTQNLGLDQTQISNAADIYRGIYNATMSSPVILNGSTQDNAYGKRNIQYSAALNVEDYDELIRDAAAKGNNLLAGFYEDSRNALLHSLGKDYMQTSTYNGGWNYVDNGGGTGNLYTGAVKDPVQTNQALGGGWYAGQGKGNATEEYFYRNTDAPTMQEVLAYAKMKGYNTEDESAVIPLGNLAREMMAGGYVSPETLQRAKTLKSAVPAALKNLGIESNSSGTDALDAAIYKMQSVGGDYAKTMQQMMTNGSLPQSYAVYGGNAESQLMNLYGDDGSYAAALRQLKEMTDAQVKQSTSGYEAQKGTVNSSYADMFRQLYVDRENAKKNIGQKMAAQGITGGASESALLGLNTAYQEALRQGEQERIGTLSDLDQAILQAQLTGNISYAQQALQMEQKRLDNYANMLKTVLNRQDAAALQNYNRQLEKAELLASIGDFSGYKVLGLTDEEIAALGKAYAAMAW